MPVMINTATSIVLSDVASSTNYTGGEIAIAPRLEAAIAMLFEAMDYAIDVNACIWDFAVEISTLLRLKLSKSDYRWLVRKGIVEHGMEVSLSGDSERSFRRSPRIVFSKRTCFVLTQAGAELARVLSRKRNSSERLAVPILNQSPSFSVNAPLQPLVPKWDRDRQQLKVGLVVVKQFKVPAPNQESILAAFEEESWPPRIDDPLPPRGESLPKRRLQETIKSLNKNQKRSLIRFLGDGSGEGIRWELGPPVSDSAIGARST